MIKETEKQENNEIVELNDTELADIVGGNNTSQSITPKTITCISSSQVIKIFDGSDTQKNGVESNKIQLWGKD